jgi:hypothetical protein
MLTLDDVLPDPHFRERHACHIDAPPQAVWDVLQELRLGELALSRALMRVRLLPMRLAGRSLPGAGSGRFIENGPLPLLASEAPHAAVLGAAMQPWKLTNGYDGPRLDAVGLRAFAEPGWAKAGADFVLEAEGTGTRLTTETRVTATDRRSRVLFGLYWAAIRAGSGLIRRDMLRAVARRAERAAA